MFASSIGEAADQLQQSQHFRMILLDYNLPDTRGCAGLLELQLFSGTIPIVVLSRQDDVRIVDAIHTMGAAGFLPKHLSVREIADCLHAVSRGQTIFPEGTRPHGAVARAQSRIATLSPAQTRVMLALADGRSNKQIAGDLTVSEATIKAHMTAIFRKLGVSNRAQVLIAMQPVLGSA